MSVETAYQLDGQLHHPDDVDFQAWLKDVHDRHRKPTCMCSGGPDGLGLDMTVALIRGTYYIKRMPFTGTHHAPGCEHYELPELLSGEATALRAVSENTITGISTLNLGFKVGLKADEAKEEKPKGASKPKPMDNKASRSQPKLTLLGLLHYLYGQTHFNHWSPRMAGKRFYGRLQYFITQVVERSDTRKFHLNDRFWMPPKWSKDKAEANERLFYRFTNKLKPNGTMRPLGIVVGEVRSMTETSIGNKRVALKHTKEPIFADESIIKHLEKKYPYAMQVLSEPDSDFHVLMIATVECSSRKNLNADQMSLMVVDQDWLPIESSDDFELIDGLKPNRYFNVPLRYDISSDFNLPSAVLTDTLMPTAIYIHDEPMDSVEMADLFVECVAADAGEGIETLVWFSAESAVPKMPPSTYHQTHVAEEPQSADLEANAAAEHLADQDEPPVQPSETDVTHDLTADEYSEYAANSSPM